MLDTLHSILDTHPDLILRYDRDLRITYVNQAYASFVGRPRSELIGSWLLDRVDDDMRADILRELCALQPDRPSYTKLVRLERSPDEANLFWTNIALFDEDKLTGYQSVGREISVRLSLQAQLEEKTRELEQVQQELRFVLNAVPSMIWYKDDQNRILRLNQAAANSMGMSVEAVEGQSTYDLFGESAKSYHEADLQVINSGEAIRGMIEAYTPNDGESGWIQTDKIPLDDISGNPRILVVSTDITEMKEQQAILGSINQNLDDFASLVSHDLKAPLRKIAISSELMELELGDRLPEESRSYFSDISNGVMRMRELIGSFLAFMRASPESVALEPVDLGSLIRELIEQERDMLSDIGATLTPPEEELIVKGDKALLRQVFSNLIENAVKYRSPDRPLHVSISAQRNKLYWEISVCDNGSGIDPAQREKVFDLFGRAKPHIGIEGSGIGLALCRRIITLQGGTIDLVDKETPGSCFQINLYRAIRDADG